MSETISADGTVKVVHRADADPREVHRMIAAELAILGRLRALADDYTAADYAGRQAIIARCHPDDAGPLADELRRRAELATAEAAELRKLAKRRERPNLRAVD